MGDVEFENLTKKERRELAKEQKRGTQKKKGGLVITKRIWLIVIIVGLLAYAGFRVIQWINAPALELSSEVVTLQDVGRNHVEDGTQLEHNSNPPTSGSHYSVWTKAGVYDKPISDGHLVHSLEHGYVVISYNCLVKDETQSLVSAAYAHEEDLPISGGESTGDVELVGNKWESEECNDLVSKLRGIIKSKGKSKIIVIPRANLDTRIALTVWTKLDKFNDFDEERIVAFVDHFRNKGPERTVE